MVSFIGFAYLVYQMYALRAGLYKDEEAASRRFVDYLQKLGPFFIKIAQIIGLKGGYFPSAATRMMRELHNSVTLSFADSYLDSVLPPGVILDSRTPVAVGSFAGVFRGTYRGEPVAVKVKHKGQEAQVLRTERLMKQLQGLLSCMRPFCKSIAAYGLKSLLEQMMVSLKEQCNFELEVSNARRMYGLIADVCTIPLPYDEVSNNDVIVMQWIDIVPFKEVPQADKAKLLSEFSYVAFRCMIGHRFYHGDVHEGNVFCTRIADGSLRLGMCDFGACCEVPQDTANRLIDLFYEFIGANTGRAATMMLEQFCFGRPSENLHQELKETLDSILCCQTREQAIFMRRIYKPFLRSGCALRPEYTRVHTYMLMCDAMMGLLKDDTYIMREMRGAFKRMVLNDELPL